MELHRLTWIYLSIYLSTLLLLFVLQQLLSVNKAGSIECFGGKVFVKLMETWVYFCQDFILGEPAKVSMTKVFFVSH